MGADFTPAEKIATGLKPDRICRIYTPADRAPLAAAFPSPVMSDRIGYPVRFVGGPIFPFLLPDAPGFRSKSTCFEEENIMSSRLFRLTEIHQRIDDALRHEQKRRFPDLFRTMKLKKLKLRTKDLIHRLYQSPRSAG